MSLQGLAKNINNTGIIKLEVLILAINEYDRTLLSSVRHTNSSS